MKETPEEVRRRLLATFPDIAAAVDKVENLPERPRTTTTGPKRAKGWKRVKPCKGVKSYTTVDWAAKAQSRKKYPTGAIVRSPGNLDANGRKRRKRHN